VALLTLLLAAPAQAQSQSAVGVGLAVSSYEPTSTAALGSVGVGPLFRLRSDPGLGVAVGFNWFTSRAARTIDGERATIARVRIRPVMVGVGYRLGSGRVRTTLNVVAGYAFNSVRPTQSGADAYARGRVSLLALDVSNCFAWRARVAFWYDVAPRVGILTAVGYLGARPRLTVLTRSGVERIRHRADSIVLTVGAVYGIF
jgi:hypothetical protein